MENISKSDISFRLDKIKAKASEINKNIEENNKEFETRYNFAKKVGIKVDDLNNSINEVSNGLNKYIAKVDDILKDCYEKEEDDANIEEYKLLNNILYLDDIKLKNINELVIENKNLTTKEYINLFANKANDLIRQEELKKIDCDICKYSKINIFEKITGKSKMKKAMLENCNLKRVEVMNKKYIPENKSLYEIVSITNNCGYKSKEIEEFVSNIVNEFKLEKPSNEALINIEKEKKIPFLYNKDFLDKINMENTDMLDRINNKKKNKVKTSEYEMYNEMLINDMSTLELFNFNSIVDEVV